MEWCVLLLSLWVIRYDVSSATECLLRLEERSIYCLLAFRKWLVMSPSRSFEPQSNQWWIKTGLNRVAEPGPLLWRVPEGLPLALLTGLDSSRFEAPLFWLVHGSLMVLYPSLSLSDLNGLRFMDIGLPAFKTRIRFLYSISSNAL